MKRLGNFLGEIALLIIVVSFIVMVVCVAIIIANIVLTKIF